MEELGTAWNWALLEGTRPPSCPLAHPGPVHPAPACSGKAGTALAAPAPGADFPSRDGVMQVQWRGPGWDRIDMGA